MTITVQDILAAKTDESLLTLLGKEIKERLQDVGDSPEDELRAMQLLPDGLRAMAAIHSLDVSIVLDDLVWHFFNHHDHGRAAETLRGLRVLEADEAASIFAEAYRLVAVHWEAIGLQRIQQADTWYDVIESSGLEAAVAPLNQRMTDLCTSLGRYGLMQYWLDFARKYPARVFGLPHE